jgi:hypothetical protein
MHFIGDKGTITLEDAWHYDAPVYFSPVEPDGTALRERLRRGLRRAVGRAAQRLVPGRHWRGRRLPVPLAKGRLTRHARMDFARGPALQAQAIRSGGQPPISGEMLLHVTELALAMQYPDRFASPYTVRSTLTDWAEPEGIAPCLPPRLST